MRIKKSLYTRVGLWSLVLLMAVPPGGIMAQGMNSGEQMTFRQEELDQMLAPIALYPDELLSQILMAATYPLEVVEAARWVQANPNLRGDQLAAALEQREWDPSVKSLVNFPPILQMMSEKLEWTEILGDAFLAGQDQVMDTIQKLRQKAQAQGSLRTTNEQRVITDPLTQTIVIEPANPQVVYAPAYDPMVVYGPWWWPAFPPFFYYPRGVVALGRLIGFGLGVAVGVAWGYAWGGFDWHHHNVVVNSNRNVHLNTRIDRTRYTSPAIGGIGSRGVWVHDPNHRRGVAYRSPSIAQQFGRGPLPGVDARRSFRGYDRPATGGVIPQGINRPGLQQSSRVTTGPNVVRSEPFRQPASPIQQPRVTPDQRMTRTEPPKQPSTVGQQPRFTPSSSPARPEGLRQQPAPGHQGVQGLQGPSAFGGFGPGGQTQQVSNRGHESLSGARAVGRGPGDSRPGPGGGHSGGGPAHERGK